jgi:hypothetical protein
MIYIWRCHQINFAINKLISIAIIDLAIVSISIKLNLSNSTTIHSFAPLFLFIIPKKSNSNKLQNFPHKYRAQQFPSAFSFRESFKAKIKPPASRAEKQIGLWGREIDCLYVPLKKYRSIRVVVLAGDKMRQIT